MSGRVISNKRRTGAHFRMIPSDLMRLSSRQGFKTLYSGKELDFLRQYDYMAYAPLVGRR